MFDMSMLPGINDGGIDTTNAFGEKVFNIFAISGIVRTAVDPVAD